MLPIKLEIEGLYSYKEKQIVDFKTLTSSWLFGIFGRVGSGKSSIIDAMTLAIYGEVERLGGNDNKNYNLMNLDSNELIIDFECKIDDELYKFRYSLKRNGKHHDKVNSPKKIISVFSDNQWIPVDKTGEEILKISYDNFKQAVVIPQGKFQKFISQGATDRTKMLSEIFKLSRYNLEPQIKKLKIKTKEKKLLTEGVISGIPKIDIDELKKKKEDLLNNNEKVVNLKKEIEFLRENDRKLNKAKKIFDDYNKILDEYSEYKIKNNNLSSVKRKIIIFEEIAPYIKQKNKISIKLKENQENLSEFKNKLNLKEEKILNIKNIIDTLKLKDYEISKKEIFISDFKNIIRINKINKELEELKILKNNLEIELKENNKIYDLKKIEIINLKEDKNKFKNDFSELNFLEELIEWHLKYDNFIDKLNDIKEKKNKYTLINENLKLERANILNTIPSDNKLLESRDKLNSYIDDLKLKQKISEYSKEIKEGVACPLCGSLEHPDILKIDIVDNELSLITKELENINKQIEEMKDNENKIKLIELEISKNLDEIEKSDENIKILNKEISFLTSNFNWSDEYKNKESFYKLKLKKQKINSNIDEIENKLHNENKDLAKLLLDIQGNREVLAGFNTELKIKQEKLDEIIKELKKIDYEDYLNVKNEEILKYITDYQIEIKIYNEELSKNNKELIIVENEINRIKDLIPRIASDIDDFTSEVLKIQKILSLKIKGIATEEEVLKILKEDFDLIKNKNNVEEVKVRFSFLEIRLRELIDEKISFPYNESDLLSNNNILNEKIDNLDEVIKDSVTLENTIKIEEENLIKLSENIEKIEEVNKRYDNLKKLEGLFKAQGFVRFISYFYLKKLIYNANKRFSRLTKNQLELGLDEKGNFIIKDFLNGGKTRLLKTLSGGQTFQASFCIALALAESINLINKQKENFFFIDEGFGSLDKDSLKLVFNTLNSLRYEKRIIGVISHVEEFKKEVDISINIKRDKKHGSIIKTSW